ncbi:MAG TPA: hypothetical protein VGJ66_26675 [Pyrinomonadaceae bacterium]
MGIIIIRRNFIQLARIVGSWCTLNFSWANGSALLTNFSFHEVN